MVHNYLALSLDYPFTCIGKARRQHFVFNHTFSLAHTSTISLLRLECLQLWSLLGKENLVAMTWVELSVGVVGLCVFVLFGLEMVANIVIIALESVPESDD